MNYAGVTSFCQDGVKQPLTSKIFAILDGILLKLYYIGNTKSRRAAWFLFPYFPKEEFPCPKKSCFWLVITSKTTR